MSASAVGPRRRRATAVIEPRLPGVRARVRELHRHRHLIGYFGRRAVERLYARTVLGRAWLVIRPGMDVGMRALFFGGILAAPSDGRPYLLFLFTGMTAWTLVDRGLLWITRSIEMNRRLVRQVFFPRLVLPLAAVAPVLVEFAILAALTALVFGGYWALEGTLHLEVGWTLLYAVAAALLLLAFALGAGLWTSVLGASTRDMRFGLRYLTEVLFFLTPVVYALDRVPAVFRDIVEHNPLTPIVELFKLGIFGSGDVDPVMLGVAVGVIVALWAGGLVFFTRTEAASVDRI